MERNRIWYWYSHLQNISIHKLNCLAGQFPDPEELMNFTDGDLEALGNLTEREKQIFRLHRDNREMILESYERLAEEKIRFVSFEEEEYPGRLLTLPDRPVGLFVRGHMPGKDRLCVAIVGARACSAYGRDCAGYFARALSAAGVAIVSGMANGIDSEAQTAAMPERGGSYAVLGGGVDLCYPKESYELYAGLSEHGGVISEMLPGTKGRPYLFPRRNRIISGMSEAVVVIEARERSGSLITANYAAEQGRLVYAVPGRVDSMLSCGCHNLIRNGAILLQRPEELLEDLKLTMEAQQTREFASGRAALSRKEIDVYEQLNQAPEHVEELLYRTGYPAGDLMHTLLQLEIKGYVCQSPQNYYRRTALRPPKLQVAVT